MESSDEISQIIERLESLVVNDESRPPATVLDYPESGLFLKGNRDGLIRLAASALRASRGEKQDFKDASWVTTLDNDYVIGGFELDEAAHIHLPEKKNRAKQGLQNLLGMVLLIAIVGLLFIGAATVIRWIFF